MQGERWGCFLCSGKLGTKGWWDAYEHRIGSCFKDSEIWANLNISNACWNSDRAVCKDLNTFWGILSGFAVYRYSGILFRGHLWPILWKTSHLNTLNKEVLHWQSRILLAFKRACETFYFGLFSFVRNFLQKYMIWGLRVLVSYYQKLLSRLFMACLSRRYSSLSDINL